MSFGVAQFGTAPFGDTHSTQDTVRSCVGVSTATSSASAVSSREANVKSGVGNAAGTAFVSSSSVWNWLGTSAGVSSAKAIYIPVPSGRCRATSSATADGRYVKPAYANIPSLSIANGVGGKGGPPSGECTATSSAQAKSAIAPTKTARGLSQAYAGVAGFGDCLSPVSGADGAVSATSIVQAASVHLVTGRGRSVGTGTVFWRGGSVVTARGATFGASTTRSYKLPDKEQLLCKTVCAELTPIFNRVECVYVRG